MTLHNLNWKPHSPSLYQLQGEECAIIMAPDRRWFVYCRGSLAWIGHWTRDDAAGYVAAMFAQAEAFA